MDYSSHFYITLPSNSSSFPDNTLDDFRVKLPEQIRLSENWEVALAEITYPHTWFNIRGSGKYYLTVEYKTFGSMRADLIPNYYADVEEICSALNRQVTDWMDTAKIVFRAENIDDHKVTFAYSKTDRKVRMSIAKPDQIQRIKFSGGLAHVLGFEETYESPKGSSITAKFPPDINVSFVAMFVYCDLLPNLIIGDVLAPLLRTVNVEGKHDEVVCRTYDAPHYLPLTRREFGSIRITIKDDVGEPLKFQWGKIVIKLHFRRQHFLP